MLRIVCFSHVWNGCMKFTDACNALIIDGDVVSNLATIVKRSGSSDWTWKPFISENNIFQSINIFLLIRTWGLLIDQIWAFYLVLSKKLLIIKKKKLQYQSCFRRSSSLRHIEKYTVFCRHLMEYLR